MIIDKKGKLFGVVNIIDVAVVLIILLAVAGVAYKLFGTQINNVVAPTQKVIVTMRIRDALPFLYDELNKSDKTLVYGNVYDSSAKIININKNQNVKFVPTADGKMARFEDPNKIDVVVQIEASVPANAATFRFGNQDIKTGRTFILKTRTFESVANIEAVEFVK